MKNMISLCVTLLLFITQSILAQLTIKDQESTPNTLLQVNDEGNAGSIYLPYLSTHPGDLDQKLYNYAGKLIWNGNELGSAYSAGGWTNLSGNIYTTSLTDKVGIGTSTPIAALHVNGNDGLVVQGTHGSGTTQNLGFGTRMLFYPKKSAFRAGFGDTEWNDSNIGEYSVAMGAETEASGQESTALGSKTKASGYASTAMGESTIANGFISIAMGSSTQAIGILSFSSGYGTIAESFNSTVFGSCNIGGGAPDSWIATDPLFEIGNGNYIEPSNALTVLKNGNVGIGPASPTASLHVTGNDGALFEGTEGSGAIPKQGAGERMMWYPHLTAFRVGSVTGTQWDHVNIGLNSIAIGANTIANGWISTAMGSSTIASGHFSTAMGHNTTASAESSTAMGYYTTASGYGSTAMGSNTTASNNYSTAFGNYSTASGDNSTAMGYNAIAGGNHSVAIGTRVSTNGSGSFIFGDNSGYTLSKGVNNRFYGRFSEGYVLYTDPEATIAASLWGGANSWTSISDSTKKENFKLVNGEDILNKISKFSLGTWNYIGQDPKIFRHYGPMAQDFYAAFGNDGIGTIGCDTLLSSADFDGINLIAIQALEKRTKEQESRIENLEKKLSQLQNLISDLNLNDDKKVKLSRK